MRVALSKLPALPRLRSHRLVVFCCLLLLPAPVAGPQAPVSSSHTTSPVNAALSAVVQLIAVGPANQGMNRSCAASGILIDEQGYVITAAHVVEAARECLENAPGAKILAKLTISGPNTAQAVPCDLIGIDADHDLALLKTERPLAPRSAGQPPFAPLDSHPLTMEGIVTVSGYPAFAWQPVTQTGRLIWAGKTRLDDADPNSALSDAVMMDIPLRPGNSGGPVVLATGGVIAVVDKRDALRPAYSVAVAIHYAIELAEHYGARWHGVD